MALCFMAPAGWAETSSASGPAYRNTVSGLVVSKHPFAAYAASFL